MGGGVLSQETLASQEAVIVSGHAQTYTVPQRANRCGNNQGNSNSPGCEAAIIRVPKALVPPSGIVSKAPATFCKPPLAEVADVDVNLGVAREAMSLLIRWICSSVKGTSSSPLSLRCHSWRGGPDGTEFIKNTDLSTDCSGRSCTRPALDVRMLPCAAHLAFCRMARTPR